MQDADLAACHVQFMRERSASLMAGVVKADLRAAVDAIDQWVSDNAASFNSAIPQPARAALTAAQKAELFLFVVRKRFQVGA